MLFSPRVFGQLRLIHVPDTHSNLQILRELMLAGDFLGQSFLKTHARGEVMFLFTGDYWSINPVNQKDGGWLELEALVELRKRGYTIGFVFGNHDGWDWSSGDFGVRLMIEQLKFLHNNGVILMAENLRNPTPELAGLFTSSYRFKTLKQKTRLIGLTLPNLVRKSGLSQRQAAELWEGIEEMPQTLRRLRDEKRYQDEQLIVGIHQGHNETRKDLDELRSEKFDFKISAVLGGHDHIITSYIHEETLISGGGSYGSFNVVDFDRNGKLEKRKVKNVAINNEGTFQGGQFGPFQGRRVLNAEILQQREKALVGNSRRPDPWGQEYFARVDAYVIEAITRLSKQRGFLREAIRLHKMDLKAGPNFLGRALANSVLLYSILELDEPFNAAASDKKVLRAGMINSSSYRLEEYLKAGVLTEYVLREMYSYDLEAIVIRVSGKIFKMLYWSLRNFVRQSDPRAFSPHLSSNFKEENNQLWTVDHSHSPNGWRLVENEEIVQLAIDGWIADHIRGESYQIKEWIEVLTNSSSHPVLGRKQYQEILVEYLPVFLEERFRADENFYDLSPSDCRSLLSSRSNAGAAPH